MTDRAPLPFYEPLPTLLGCFKADPPSPDLSSSGFYTAIPEEVFALRAEGLSGDLSAVALFDILSLLEMGRRTGVLATEGPEPGALYFDEGRLFHVTAKDLAGDEALHVLLQQRQGRFRFEPRPSSGVPVTVHAASVKLLVENTRHATGFHRASVSALDGLPQIGSVVDKYRLDGLLGVGGFAAVYKATHLILRTQVAIKMLKAKLLRERPHLTEHLCEEARFAATVDHPRVVRVLDVTHSPRLTYIVMEYVEGRSVHEEIRQLGRLDARTVVSIGRQAAQGLAAALEKGLIHRDIKPANLLLDSSGLLKIVDLGLARPVEDRGEVSDTVVGTPEYMPREQALSPDSVDFRADIYALGMTLFHAVTGGTPFADADPLAVVQKLLTSRVPPITEPDCPPELARLIAWMTEEDVQARPRSYRELLDAFDETAAAMASAGAVAIARPSEPHL